MASEHYKWRQSFAVCLCNSFKHSANGMKVMGFVLHVMLGCGIAVHLYSQGHNGHGLRGLQYSKANINKHNLLLISWDPFRGSHHPYRTKEISVNTSEVLASNHQGRNLPP